MSRKKSRTRGISAETAKALYEMGRLAAKQVLNYEGPIMVTICGRGQEKAFRRLRSESRRASWKDATHQ